MKKVTMRKIFEKLVTKKAEEGVSAVKLVEAEIQQSLRSRLRHRPSGRSGKDRRREFSVGSEKFINK